MYGITNNIIIDNLVKTSAIWLKWIQYPIYTTVKLNDVWRDNNSFQHKL